MALCSQVVDAMRTAEPAEAERLRARLDDMIKNNLKFPTDFKRKVLNLARTYECNSNMRATDAALHDAMEKARHDDRGERTRLITEARVFSRKAMSLGADEAFKAAVARKIDITMETGGVEHKGPTIAKPLASSLKNPRNAKTRNAKN